MGLRRRRGSPILDGVRNASAKFLAAKPVTAGAATRVLVVDADPVHCKAMRVALLGGAYHVTAASTAADALAMAVRLRPHVIVVGASLAAAFGALLEGGPLGSVPIVAVAGGEGVPVADVMLPSPVDALELLATVRLLAGISAQ
jgi:CheY-like chemotaxis protein